MNEKLHSIIEFIATIIEVIGILTILVGALLALGRFLLKKQGKK